MVRTAENYLAGPYTRDQIRQLVREVQLGLQDEVCQANHYWFFLHERDEVVRQLGNDVVSWLGESGEEITLTQTEPSIEEIELTERKAAEGMDRGDGSTTVIAALPHSALRLRERKGGIQPPGDTASAEADVAQAATKTAPLVHVSPSGHTGVRWRMVLWVALIAAAVVLALLLELARQGG